jgi:hypothetical protein
VGGGLPRFASVSLSSSWLPSFSLSTSFPPFPGFRRCRRRGEFNPKRIFNFNLIYRVTYSTVHHPPPSHSLGQHPAQLHDTTPSTGPPPHHAFLLRSPHRRDRYHHPRRDAPIHDARQVTNRHASQSVDDHRVQLGLRVGCQAWSG